MGGVSVPCLYHSIFKGSRHRPWETDTEAKLQKISWRTSIQIKRGKISDLHEGELKQTIHWRCPVVVTNGQALVLLPCPITIGCCQKKKKSGGSAQKLQGSLKTQHLVALGLVFSQLSGRCLPERGAQPFTPVDLHFLLPLHPAQPRTLKLPLQALNPLTAAWGSFLTPCRLYL